MPRKKLSRFLKSIIWLFVLLIIIYAALLIPEEAPPIPQTGGSIPFLWNQDEVWKDLELQFNQARIKGCLRLKPSIDSSFNKLKPILKSLDSLKLEPTAPEFKIAENEFFKLSTMTAVCDERLSDYINMRNEIRNAVKKQSSRWNMENTETRNTLYRILYGMRAAEEEVLLQYSKEKITETVRGINEPSDSPEGRLGKLRVRSGDILISRGGVPTSALIARGNDYPGNFSHAALVFVDSKTKQVSIIESHIEVGVVISTPEQYLSDKKLRIMVLRPRYDLPQMKTDAMLPHRAALYAYTYAASRHIPYDFELNYNDSSKLFCSEVISYAYSRAGMNLWMGMTHISSKGLAGWLSSLGVRYFKTQEPADLEYDPQISVVSEWINPETLYQDHIDNAVIDVMLEGAEKGNELSYDWYMLPIARVLKLYSLALNYYDKTGPIPEGMSAGTALRADKFTKLHDELKSKLMKKADEFKRVKGYTPPYWELLKMARSN